MLFGDFVLISCARGLVGVVSCVGFREEGAFKSHRVRKANVSLVESTASTNEGLDGIMVVFTSPESFVSIGSLCVDSDGLDIGGLDVGGGDDVTEWLKCCGVELGVMDDSEEGL